MTQQDKSQQTEPEMQPWKHPDRSVWLAWLVLVLVAVAILPFALRNSEVVRQIAAMCGFDLG